MVLERYRVELGEELTRRGLGDREVGSRVRISEQGIDRHLVERQAAAAAARPVQIHLAQILVSVAENSTAEQEQQRLARAQALRKALVEQGADFETLARKESDATDQARGVRL